MAAGNEKYAKGTWKAHVHLNTFPLFRDKRNLYRWNIPLKASLEVLTSSVVPSQNAELQNVCHEHIWSLFLACLAKHPLNIPNYRKEEKRICNLHNIQTICFTKNKLQALK